MAPKKSIQQIIDDIVTPADLGIPERKDKIFQQRTTAKPLDPSNFTDVLGPEHYGIPDKVDPKPQPIRHLPGDHDPGTKRWVGGKETTKPKKATVKATAKAKKATITGKDTEEVIQQSQATLDALNKSPDLKLLSRVAKEGEIVHYPADLNPGGNDIFVRVGKDGKFDGYMQVSKTKEGLPSVDAIYRPKDAPGGLRGPVVKAANEAGIDMSKAKSDGATEFGARAANEAQMETQMATTGNRGTVKGKAATATVKSAAKPANFEEWMAQADQAAKSSFASDAQSIFDDAGVVYRDMYDKGMSPKQAINQSVAQLHPSDVKAMRQAAKSAAGQEAGLAATTEEYRSTLPKPRSAVAKRANSIAAEERIDAFRAKQDPRAVIASRNATTPITAQTGRGQSIIDQLMSAQGGTSAPSRVPSQFGTQDFDAYMNTNPLFNPGHGGPGSMGTYPSAPGAATATGAESVLGRAMPTLNQGMPPSAASAAGPTIGGGPSNFDYTSFYGDGAPGAATGAAGTAAGEAAAMEGAIGATTKKSILSSMFGPSRFLQVGGDGALAGKFNTGTSMIALAAAHPVAHQVDNLDLGGHNSIYDNAATGFSGGLVATKGNPVGAGIIAGGNMALGAARSDMQDAGWRGLVGQGLDPKQTVIRDQLLKAKASGNTDEYNKWANIAAQSHFAIPDSVTAQRTGSSVAGVNGDVDPLTSILGQLGLSPEAQTSITDELAMHQKLSALQKDPKAYMEEKRQKMIDALPGRVAQDKASAKNKGYSTEQTLALQQMVANIMQPAEQQFLTSGNMQGAIYDDLANKSGLESELGQSYKRRGDMYRANANSMAAAARAQASTLPAIAEMERISQNNAQAVADQRAMNNSNGSNNILSQLGLS